MDEVCEAYREREPRMRGSTIPAMPKCIPDLEVQRLEIELKYNYDSAYELFEHEEIPRGAVGFDWPHDVHRR